MVTPSSIVNKTSVSTICYAPTTISVNGIWQGSDPLSFALPLFIAQVIFIVFTTRFMVFLLKPFRQPRVLAEIIGGIVLGPSVLGRIKGFGDEFFPAKSSLTLETVAHFGLVFFLFIIGVEMDIMVFRRTGKKAIMIAGAGMVIPFCIGSATSFVFSNLLSYNVRKGSFLLFLGVALSVTAFPVLARILAEIKLLNSDIGRMSMSAAIINDMLAWVLLALSIALVEEDTYPLAPLWVILAGFGFILVCFFCVRPAMWWMMKRIPEGQGVSDFHICIILVGVMLAGLVTDFIGIHAVFGGFVFGLVVPNGQLGLALIERLEDVVTNLFLPLFFTISGLRTDLSKVRDPKVVGLLVVVFIFASIGKIAGTTALALLYMMPLREGLALGFLMNTRGLVEMIILNIGRDKQVLDDESFAVLVLISLVMTATVTPAVQYLHRPTRRLIGYKRRNLQRSKPDTEIRMLACVHNTRNVPSIITLLDLSNPTKRSPIFLYALHLVELTGHASSLLVIHSSSNNKPSSGRSSRALTGTQAQSHHIFNAFENYEQHAGGVSVQTMTTVSPYATMHEDICALAEEKHVSLIVLPFHKQQAVDGAMQPINPSVKALNENVLRSTPCSVAILVDRGISANTRGVPGQFHAHQIALLFFGGPDDREALAYAWRMIENPGVNLTVVRFLAGDEVAPSPSVAGAGAAATRDFRVVDVVTNSTLEKELDDEYMNDFRLKNVGNDSVVYTEKVVTNSEETTGVLRSMESIHDLYIVGRGQENGTSSLTAGLTEFEECPELGPIGDLLASSDFATTVSVLVVQQYVGGVHGMEGPGRAAENFDNSAEVGGRPAAFGVALSRR